MPKNGYARYYELCLRLVRRGGLIALDNMLQNGRVLDPADRDEATEAIRAMNRVIAKDERVLPDDAAGGGRSHSALVR